MGMLISVYRSTGMDCTLGGVSSVYDKLCVVNIPGPFGPCESYSTILKEFQLAAPLVFLEKNIGNTLRIIPAEWDEKQQKWVPTNRWAMMGGNYGATSDSRFGRACENLLGHEFYGAVAIHDRFED